MNNGGRRKVSVLALLLCCAHLLVAQVPFDLDEGFRTELNKKFVNSMVELDNGDLLLSGILRWDGDLFDRGYVRVTPSGQRIADYPDFAPGGGKITPWSDRYYIGNGPGVRRIFADGSIDPEYVLPSAGPYVFALQGGDYHVFPDGRVLVSGGYVLSDSIRGFEGLYSLIWFSNEGYLDTTRTHRQCNGVIYAIEEQPAGKFLCTGTMTTYEGQPVKTVFRVEADGTLDTSFDPPLQWYGEARDYHTLPDGRIMVAGPLKLIGSDQIQGVIRLHADGSLDESYELLQFSSTFTPSQIPLVLDIYELSPDRFIINGVFDKINGIDRGGIAMIDSSGALVEDVFDGLGCGAYDFVVPSGSTTYKYISGIVPSSDGGFFIHGGYHGYDDGTTNDTTQRMVSKLYGLSVGVDEPAAPLAATLRMYPNPASAYVVFEVALLDVPKNGRIRVLDIAGRELEQLVVNSQEQQLVLDSRKLAAGTYTVVLEEQGAALQTKSLVIR